MTDEEKAAVFIKRHWGHYTEDFRNAMVPALVKLIRDEREACAKIAEEVKNARPPRFDEDIYYCAGLIERRIRARSK